MRRFWTFVPTCWALLPHHRAAGLGGFKAVAQFRAASPIYCKNKGFRSVSRLLRVVLVRRNLPHGKFQVIQDDAPKGTISLRSRARVPFLANKARLARLSGRRPRRIATMIEWVLTPDAGASLRSAALKPFENKGFWARHGICCVVLVCENLPVAPICALQAYPVGWFCR